jgi:protein CpxP
MRPTNRFRPETAIMRDRPACLHLLLAGLAAAAGLTGTALAAEPPATTGAPPALHQGRGAGLELRHALRELNLSPDQQTQVKAIYAAAKGQMQAQRTQARANRQALRAASPNDPGYPALLATVKADAAAGIQLASDLRTQVYAVLTPEQQARIPALQAAARSRWAARKAAWQAQHAAD